MQLKLAYIFRFGCIGGALEVICEVLDPLHIVMLGLLRELADRHVLDHAPTQRADSLLGHGAAPVLSEVANPSISRQDAPIRYTMSRARGGTAAPYRASGTVSARRCRQGTASWLASSFDPLPRQTQPLSQRFMLRVGVTPMPTFWHRNS